MSDNNSVNNSSNKPANKNSRYKKNNRYKGNKNKSKNSNAQSNPNQKNANANSNSGSSNKPKRNNSRNRRPKTLTPARILQKYENLLEQHLIARKKFYEMHGRITGKQLEKVEFNYNKTMKALYEYENTLPKEWQKEVLQNKLELYPQDRQFSTTHELEPVGELEEVPEDFDIHLLPTQVNHDWSNDTEESSGTIEDYKAYKGITD